MSDIDNAQQNDQGAQDAVVGPTSGEIALVLLHDRLDSLETTINVSNTAIEEGFAAQAEQQTYEQEAQTLYMETLKTEIRDVKTEVSSLTEQLQHTEKTINLQFLIFSIFVVLLLLGLVLTILLQRKSNKEIRNSFVTPMNDGMDHEDRQRRADYDPSQKPKYPPNYHPDYHPQMSRGEPNYGMQLPATAVVPEPIAPPMPRVITVQDVLNQTNAILLNPEFSKKVFRLVLTQIDKIENLLSYDSAGSVLRNTDQISVVQAQSEGAFFGMVENGQLYLFPNRNMLSVVQASDKLFDGFRAHTTIESIVRPARLTSGSNHQWVLASKGELR